MATKLPRKNQKVLGSNSSRNGQFGSRSAGLGNFTNDIEELQALSAWVNGWNDATVSGQKLPCLEEMQGTQYVQTYQLAYLFQEGIPEYNAATPYFIGSIVKKAGTTELYESIADDNTGHALTDNTNWRYCVDLANVAINGAPIATTSGTTKDVSISDKANKIIINFAGVSIDNTGVLSLLLGTAAAFEILTYSGGCSSISTAGAAAADSSTVAIIAHRSLVAADLVSGTVVLTRESSVSNTWTYTVNTYSSAGLICSGSGSKALAAPLTRIRLTTLAGTPNFDGGSFNVRTEC